MGIEVKNINKLFGEFKALDDVSLTIERGEFVCFLGPSGCGKTTILRMVSGFISPTSGTIRIGGAPSSDTASSVQIGARFGMYWRNRRKLSGT